MHDLEAMKRFLVLCTLLIVCFSPQQVLSQDKLPKFVVLKMIIKKENFEQELKIPVAKSLDSAELMGGSFAVTDCNKCLLTVGYDFFGIAAEANNFETHVTFEIKFRKQKSCDYKNEKLIIARNKTVKLKLRCGVELSAYQENNSTDNRRPATDN